MKHTPFSPQCIRRDHAAMERRRLKAAELFARRIPQAEVARRLGVTKAAVCQWYEVWSRKGVRGLKSAGPPGVKPGLTKKDRERIVRTLLEGAHIFGYGTDLWTLERVAAVIKKVAGRKYHPGHVWRILGSMGWSSQKPVKRARERNEALIEQ
ncbi:MAG: winged helix-turn-helix domain-containing protein [Patescibacteria group bacterium]